jgi:hypothetical protein
MAELESLYGADKLRLAGEQAALLNLPANAIDFARLGGTIKLCNVLTVLPTTDWKEITNHLLDAAPGHAGHLPEGKLQLGLSVYGLNGLNVNVKRLQATGLELKKAIRASGRSVRLIPNKEPELNSAQVVHNHLTGPLGWELVFVRDGQSTILAQTVAVQDIEAYAARDQKRPMRDARVGMLPPKLAQIIVNLAATGTNPHGSAVLDPFCGTGVILQEASLMGFDIYGSDLNPRMAEYTEVNLKWLENVAGHVKSHDTEGKYFRIEVADATVHTWGPAPNFIAAETYLGRPFSVQPPPEVLQEVVRDVDTIHKRFLQNVARQTHAGFRLCIAVPAWHTKNGFKHLPVLDSLEVLGYTRKSFVHVRDEDLLYHRPNQIVARELVVLVRKQE